MYPDVNVFAYRSAYRDLQEAFGNNLVAYYVHYANNGMREGRAIITIEKVAKAGVTVTGLRGQILAKPAPVAQNTGTAASTSDSASTSENSEASIPSQASSDESASMVSENPAPTSSTPASEPAKPEQPTPAPKPSEPEDPTPTPEPEDPTPTPSEPETCTHVWGCVKVDGENAHMPKCVICGATDPSQKEACTSAGKEGNATEHWSKCQYCFRIYDREDHTWENGICTVCNASCSHESWSNGACTTCGKTCGHSWDASTGICNTCGAICGHDWDSSNGICKACGKQCSHNTRNHIENDEQTHKYVCSKCKYTEIQDHEFGANGNCVQCGYRPSTSW